MTHSTTQPSQKTLFHPLANLSINRADRQILAIKPFSYLSITHFGTPQTLRNRRPMRELAINGGVDSGKLRFCDGRTKNRDLRFQ
jgi:hypothetical protein